MTVDDFTRSLALPAPPEAFSKPLCALWWDARGDWQHAHEEVDSLETVPAMAVHAYLHRKEGDVKNAGYWYHRAGRPLPTIGLANECERLLDELLAA